ncbi:recombination regulator RecX, partial [Klebsiella variicola]|nr:recombination regulator RecX [Klebsiella variicola]
MPATEPSSSRSGYDRLLDRAIRIMAKRDHTEQELRLKLAAPVMRKKGPEARDVTPE